MIGSRSNSVRALAVTLFLSGASLNPVALHPQGTGSVSGTVTDSLGAPVYSAEVGIEGVAFRTTTNETGEFFLRDVPPGQRMLTARRLGFVPVSVTVSLANSNNNVTGLQIRLGHLPMFLQPVLVQATKLNYTGRLAGYYKRLEQRNGGYFITRDQIDRENPRSLSQLLQHEPAIRGSRIRGGGSGVRMRGRTCAPLVWLDGTPMPASELDLDAISPQTIQGIELYLGSTTAPARFILNRDFSGCGTVVLWSRGPDTDPINRTSRPPQDLEALIASLRVFTADQVDSQAALTGGHLTVSYPQPLFAAGVGGSVLAEFVVDTAGHVEEGTFGIVSSSNPLFSDAVRQAVETASYAPAQKRGLKVRQLIHQPFSFVPPRQAAGG